MAGGDTLIVGDGTYAEQIARPPNGTANAYTTVKAARDWGVTIDGTGFADNYQDGIRVNGGYVVVRGFHVKMNQAKTTNLGVDLYGCNHVKVQRCSVAYGGTSDNVAAFGVGPGSDYVLLEENYVYGGARYPFLVYQSTHTVVRRNVSRLDYWNGSLQAANFTNYNGDMTVWQNNIAIDSDTKDIGGSGLYGGFFSENKVPDSSWSGTATRETFRGNIVLNVQAFYSGLSDYDVSNLHTYSDNIIWDSHGGYYGDYIHGDAPMLDATRFTIGKIRGMYSGPNGQGSAGSGFFIGPGTGGTKVAGMVTNSIFVNNPFYGLADYATGDYNAFWNNAAGNYGGKYTTPAAGSHDVTSDIPATSSTSRASSRARRFRPPDRRRSNWRQRHLQVGRDRHAVGRDGLRLDHVGAAVAVPERGRDQGRHGELQRPRCDRRPRLRDRQQPRRDAADPDQVHLGVPGQSDPGGRVRLSLLDWLVAVGDGGNSLRRPGSASRRNPAVHVFSDGQLAARPLARRSDGGDFRDAYRCRLHGFHNQGDGLGLANNQQGPEHRHRPGRQQSRRGVESHRGRRGFESHRGSWGFESRRGNYRWMRLPDGRIRNDFPRARGRAVRGGLRMETPSTPRPVPRQTLVAADRAIRRPGRGGCLTLAGHDVEKVHPRKSASAARGSLRGRTPPGSARIRHERDRRSGASASCNGPTARTRAARTAPPTSRLHHAGAFAGARSWPGCAAWTVRAARARARCGLGSRPRRASAVARAIGGATPVLVQRREPEDTARLEDPAGLGQDAPAILRADRVNPGVAEHHQPEPPILKLGQVAGVALADVDERVSALGRLDQRRQILDRDVVARERPQQRDRASTANAQIQNRLLPDLVGDSPVSGELAAVGVPLVGRQPVDRAGLRPRAPVDLVLRDRSTRLRRLLFHGSPRTGFPPRSEAEPMGWAASIDQSVDEEAPTPVHARAARPAAGVRLPEQNRAGLWDSNDVARYLKVSRSWVHHHRLDRRSRAAPPRRKPEQEIAPS